MSSKTQRTLRAGRGFVPSPLTKSLRESAQFALAIVLTFLFFFDGTPGAVPWFAAGVVFAAAAPVLAATLTKRYEGPLWPYEPVVAVLTFLALAAFEVGAGTVLAPVTFIAVYPTLLLLFYRGPRNVTLAVLGLLGSLVVPVLLRGPNLAQLSTAVIAGLVCFVIAKLFADAVYRHEGNIQALEKSEAERREAEDMLRGVWDAITEEGLIVTDPAGLIVALNPGAEKALGFSASDITFQRQLIELLEPEELTERAGGVGDAFTPFRVLAGVALDGSAERAEWTVVRADGTTIPASFTVTPRQDADGVRTGYLFVLDDLTEDYKVAKLKDDFVGLISHELRTPLSSILGYLELLRDEEGLTEEQLRYIGVAERNANRLLRLVGDLLFTAQVDAGTFKLEAHRVELEPLLSASLDTARPLADRGGVTLVADFQTRVVVLGDPGRLGQAIDNLVSNAIKFTQQGGSVTLTLTVKDSLAVISVQDTGMGIAAEEIDKLFSKFFRASTATRHAVPGVGLGLAITKAIVTAHGGQMQVESEEGVGTCFSMAIPMAKDQAFIGV